MQDYHFYLDGARCASCPIRFQNSLTVNISGRNQLMHLPYYCHFIFFCLIFFASSVKLNRSPFSYN